MLDLIGSTVQSKKTGAFGRVIGYDPGSFRTDAVRGIRPGTPFIVVKTESDDFERLHEDDFIPERRKTD